MLSNIRVSMQMLQIVKVQWQHLNQTEPEVKNINKFDSKRKMSSMSDLSFMCLIMTWCMNDNIVLNVREATDTRKTESLNGLCEAENHEYQNLFQACFCFWFLKV